MRTLTYVRTGTQRSNKVHTCDEEEQEKQGASKVWRSCIFCENRLWVSHGRVRGGPTYAYHALQKQSAGCSTIRPMKSIARNLSTKKGHSRVEPFETNKIVCLRVYSKTLVKLHICASENK